MFTAELFRQSWRSWFAQDSRPVGPVWLQYVWTVLSCVVVALGFTVAGILVDSEAGGWRSLAAWWHAFRVNLVVSLSVGCTIHVLFAASARAIGLERVRAFGRRARAVYFIGVPISGVAIGWPLGILWALDVDPATWIARNPGLPKLSLLLSLVLCVVLYHFFETQQRRIEAEKHAVEAQLKLLQGQIEPHFLFNTLANVVALMEADAPRAKAMLESFVDYLRASLGGLRSERHTLGDELTLVDAYLRIVAARMDARLAVRIDVPEELRTRPLPALTLQPLVENAIQHGLEPALDGGRLAVTARGEGRLLVVSVEDSGLGLGSASQRRSVGSGSALANIRERLRQAFGGEASLVLEPLSPNGTRARLTVPSPG